MKYSSYHGAHAAGFSLYDNKPRLSTCLSAFLKVGEDMSMIIFKLGPIWVWNLDRGEYIGNFLGNVRYSSAMSIYRIVPHQ